MVVVVVGAVVVDGAVVVVGAVVVDGAVVVEARVVVWEVEDGSVVDVGVVEDGAVVVGVLVAEPDTGPLVVVARAGAVLGVDSGVEVDSAGGAVKTCL